MRMPNSPATLALLLVTGCVGTIEPGPASAEIRSDPSILVLGVGDSRAVTVEAFVGNEPESVRWNIGTTGRGLVVVIDSSYGVTYVGNRLTLPGRSHSRRYLVTMNDTVATSFVISGGTGIVTVPVQPAVP